MFTDAAGVCAQDVLPYAAPWDEQADSDPQDPAIPVRFEKSSFIRNDDIDPRPLSLADLEKLTADPREKYRPFQDERNVIETMYSDRAGEELSLFGYDIFDSSRTASATIPAGTVTDDYVLGNGDTLDIVIKGQEQARKSYTIDTQGRLITEGFDTIAATGRTLGDVRRALTDEATRLHNVQIDVSLSAPRQIDILVIGDVKTPGRKTMTGYHSILDALTEAGGIKKSGSLRRIKLVRGGKSEFIDLYTVLMQGGAGADKKLRDGDRIIVPPIGPTLAAGGAVKRPAIYEIRKDERLSASEILGLAGGVIAPGSTRLVKLALTPDGRETVEDVADPSGKSFGDGSLLDVAQAREKRARNVELTGETRDPGEHALGKNRTLAELIAAQEFGDSLYPLIGVIERRDPQSLTRKLIEFSPRGVMEKGSDIDLSEGDRVHLFSVQQIRELSTKTSSSEPLLKNASFKKDATAPDIEDGEVASFLEERSTFVRGAVRQPGAYPVAKGTSLDSLLDAAGGMTVEADKNNIELTSAQNGAGRMTTGTSRSGFTAIRVSPGDTVRVGQSFRRVEEQSITLLGEVRNPGRYDLKSGDTLLDLIRRAGGLSEVAYPDGVIFSRASERKQEESRYKAQARDLEMKLAQSLGQDDKDKKPDMAQVGAAQGLIAQLREAKAVGRITVEADPAILAADPEQDILLEAGDKIYIPRRPLTVRVGGEVLSPAALQFRKGKDAQDYIEEAGGTTYFADADRAFVVYPDGSAKPLAVSAWKQSVTMVPPGSAIIVPRDPKPFDFLQSAETISTVFANIALTGFYLDDLHNDDD